MNIYEKLSAIQSELKAPKNQFNAFGKYKYRSCEDIMEALKPLLKKHKASVTINDSVEFVGEQLMVYSTVRLYDTEDGNTITTSAGAGIDVNKKGMDTSQTFGASSSYARKYALNGMFLIDDTKDADATNTHDSKQSKKEVSLPILEESRWEKAKVSLKDPATKSATLSHLKGYKLTSIQQKELDELVK